MSGDAVPGEWHAVDIISRSGETICTVQRDGVCPGTLGEEEIAEFIDEISECLPRSAADWLTDYLRTVSTVYAFQVYNAVEEGDGWDVVRTAKAAIWDAAGGIFQADGEGFSNEDGYHILWQFSPGVTGTWNMAVLIDGHWRPFNMDLANPDHRRCFHLGQIPPGATAPS